MEPCGVRTWKTFQCFSQSPSHRGSPGTQRRSKRLEISIA